MSVPPVRGFLAHRASPDGPRCEEGRLVDVLLATKAIANGN